MLDIVRRLESLSSVEVQAMFDADSQLVESANAIRMQQPTKPSQSQFRVVAILFVFDESTATWSIICGSNQEHGYLGGAICAERAAICRMRFYPYARCKKVIVTTDSKHGISPGALCREFLMSMGDANMPVVIANAAGDHVTKCTIGDLFPHPFLYQSTNRADIVLCAETRVSKLRQRQQSKASIDDEAIKAKKWDIGSPPFLFSGACFLSEEEQMLMQKVLQAAEAANAFDNVGDTAHPIQLSAAVVYRDGHTHSAYQMKGLEYGCTVCPVTQLLYAMEHDPVPVSEVFMLVMLDNYNLAHLPFAGARSQLTERTGRYDHVHILSQNVDGDFVITMVKDLLPQPPGQDAKLLTHDDFM